MAKKYDRAKFGSAERYERQRLAVLAHQSYTDRYDGTAMGPVDRRISVDHVYPLHLAWRLGADRWTKAKRRRFAADPLNLAVTSLHINESKGDRGVADWVPEHHEAAYVQTFRAVAREYGLPTEGS